VPNAVIDELKAREHNGAIELPRRDGFKPGDSVRLTAGPFAGIAGLYQGQRPHERVEVLLMFLGSLQKVELPRDAIEVVP
jgi:transcriptional antiterminator RfaH